LHVAPLHGACKNQPLIPHASMAVNEESQRYVAGAQSARGRTVAVAVARSAAKVRIEKCMVARASCLSLENVEAGSVMSNLPWVLRIW
jgi:hypothetical protein